MSLLIYRLAIRLYGWLLALFSFFNPKAKLFVEGRKNWQARLSDVLSSKSFEGATVLWFHAASLGEFEQARPVMAAFRATHPTYKILLTFFSPSGYEIRKNTPLADAVFYLPLDTRANAEKFIQIARPSVAFFVKYEFWYHYYTVLYEKKISLFLFSAIFREEQIFFKIYGGFFRDLLRKPTFIFTQDVKSDMLLRSIGIQHTACVGDTRFDRVIEIFESRKPIAVAQTFKNNQPIMVIGSSWDEDITVIAEAVKDFPYSLKLIIASHELTASHYKHIETAFAGKKIVYFSKPDNAAQADILIIDNVGMLSSLYGYGEIAYIGGAFGAGLHNTLEAAVYGVPLFFGNKKYTKFREATDLIEINAAQTVANGAELSKYLKELFEDTKLWKQKGALAKNYVMQHKGATQIICQVTNKRLFR